MAPAPSSSPGLAPLLHHYPGKHASPPACFLTLLTLIPAILPVLRATPHGGSLALWTHCCGCFSEKYSAVFTGTESRRDTGPLHLKRVAHECQAQVDDSLLRISRSLQDAQRKEGWEGADQVGWQRHVPQLENDAAEHKDAMGLGGDGRGGQTPGGGTAGGVHDPEVLKGAELTPGRMLSDDEYDSLGLPLHHLQGDRQLRRTRFADTASNAGGGDSVNQQQSNTQTANARGRARVSQSNSQSQTFAARQPSPSPTAAPEPSPAPAPAPSAGPEPAPSPAPAPELANCPCALHKKKSTFYFGLPPI